MIKTIIFDLGNVIVPFQFRRGYEAMKPYSNLTPEEMRARLGPTGWVPLLETGKIEPRDFVDRLCGLFDMNMSYDEFREAWSAIFLPDTLVPESLIAALGERHRMLLLSNTNAIHYEMLERAYPLLAHFHGRILSHEVGAAKPDAAIYRAALALAGCRPEECFFTDDIEQYVEAARREGIDAVQFTGLEQLEQDMRSRGIEW